MSDTKTINWADIDDVEIDGIDPGDFPDLCDSHAASATWADSGEALTEEELDRLNDDCQEEIWEMAYESFH